MPAKVIEGLSENDLDDLIALMDDQVGEPPQVRPDGFGITVKEYMEQKKCSDSLARKKLDEMVEKGYFDKKVMVEGRGRVPVVYFKKQSTPQANEG